MYRPLNRYITALVLFYILIGILYIFGLFNLNLFRSLTGGDENSSTQSMGIKATGATADSHPSNSNAGMEDELMLEYELEDEYPHFASDNNKLALGASMKWKKTLLECSRIKKDLRTVKSQLLSKYEGMFFSAFSFFY